MTQLQPARVPDLSDEWIAAHRAALLDTLAHRRRRPLRWMALGGATATAAAVSTLVLVGGSPQPAFAGWSASPTAPATGELTTADSVCQARLAQAAAMAPTSKGPAPASAASMVPELSDVRGPYTVTVFGNGTPDGVLCISSPNAVSLRWVGGQSAPAGAGAIAVDQLSVLARDSQPYTLVVGRTGVGVDGVTLVLGDGSHVTATSGSGRFVAWWPGSQTIVSAALSSVSGDTTQVLDVPGPELPPAGTKSTGSTVRRACASCTPAGADVAAS
jgi:hypothetical protein